ncbi:ABC transporter permease subunit [Anaerococcus sp.]|uniref:ABC transporter permease n=1 Tax=Anaerococcus TaxID=165779 RepID=UPI00257BE2E8|nr:ABC transporter permease subunit [Anaerococcus sp.]MBS6105591.1 ABC transporter permease subunit [Anaerococcus sp.]MDU0894868.1 ABC transporter permease subunit [Anaerococcus sp.]MDU3176539.1 ABC transporter permease subunit [Anaerococcus sp.]
MTSTTQNKFRKIIIAIIWIIIWQIMASFIKEEILLPSPLIVFKKFIYLLGQVDFYKAIFLSTIKIIAGFLISIAIGVIFAYLAYKYKLFYDFISPLIRIFRSIPLASLVIFLLFWANKDYLSIYISFIMAMPLIFQNVYDGLSDIDKNILQMADIYKVSEIKKIKYIYKVKVKAFLYSSIISISGLVFKAGIAAEVIGLPKNSIGNNLYNAKVYLDMPNLFAWTLAILLISSFFEITLKKLLGAKND